MTEAGLLDSNQTDSTAAPVAGRSSSSMRRVNSKLRRLSGTFACSEPIAFFCECPDPTCYSAIWMSAADYDATAENGTAWLLREGHGPRAAAGNTPKEATR